MIVSPTSRSCPIGFVCTTAYRLLTTACRQLASFGAIALAPAVTPAEAGGQERTRLSGHPPKAQLASFGARAPVGRASPRQIGFVSHESRSPRRPWAAAKTAIAERNEKSREKKGKDRLLCLATSSPQIGFVWHDCSFAFRFVRSTALKAGLGGSGVPLASFGTAGPRRAAGGARNWLRLARGPRVGRAWVPKRHESRLGAPSPLANWLCLIRLGHAWRPGRPQLALFRTIDPSEGPARWADWLCLYKRLPSTAF